MGELTKLLDDLKEEFKENRDEEQLWDEIYDLRDALRLHGKAIRILVEYLDAQKGESEVDLEEIKEKVERKMEIDPVE